jgi:integrase
MIDAHNFLNRAWKTVLSELEIQYRSQYNTRHTFITNCLEAGISVVQIAKWVGNSPEIIMKHYAGTIKQVEVPEFGSIGSVMSV